MQIEVHKKEFEECKKLSGAMYIKDVHGQEYISYGEVVLRYKRKAHDNDGLLEPEAL